MITFTAFRGEWVLVQKAGARPMVSADCWRIASDQLTLEFAISISALDRLSDLLASHDGALQVRVSGVVEEGKSYLQLDIRGCLQLVCQRCLESVEWPVEINTELRITGETSELAQFSNDAEFSIDDLEDVVVVGPEVSLECLIEDELLLAMPISAMHDSCKPKIGESMTSVGSPFADLREKLKNQLKE